MKAYREKKANEPVEDSPEAKPTKKGSVKEFLSKKADKKKSSPRKSGGGESQKFKSAEFVETDDSSSEDEAKVGLWLRSIVDHSEPTVIQQTGQVLLSRKDVNFRS